VKIEGLRIRRWRLGEVHQIGHDITACPSLLGDGIQCFSDMVVINFLTKGLGTTGNDGQRIVELVGGACGHRHNCLQCPSLEQLTLRGHQTPVDLGELVSERDGGRAYSSL